MKLTILSEKYKLIRKLHFFDFHEAILKSVGYTNDQMTSFFIWMMIGKKKKEVTLEEMDDNPEMDSWVMKETTISELVEDEKQKLFYVFDYMTERCFFIELSEIITGKNMTGAKCTKKSGEAPKQTVDFEEMAASGGSLDLDENFYGDQDFDMEDFDQEGFDIGGDTGSLMTKININLTISDLMICGKDSFIHRSLNH